jgi:hypothetical protein
MPQGIARSPAARRLRGASAGIAAFGAVAGLAAWLLGAGLSPGPHGELVAGLAAQPARAAALLAGAVAAGIASSAAAGAYVSGTSLLAGAGGLVAVWAAGRLSGPAAAAPGTPDGVSAAGEVLFGTGFLLAAYVVAWQTDVRWTLRGEGHARKVVTGAEVATRNLPALLVCAAVVLGASGLLGLVATGAAGSLAWLLACGLGGFAGAKLFAPRSTFFLWSAPPVALLAAGSVTGAVWAGAAGVPLACLVPLGALGVLAGRACWSFERRRACV